MTAPETAPRPAETHARLLPRSINHDPGLSIAAIPGNREAPKQKTVVAMAAQQRV